MAATTGTLDARVPWDIYTKDRVKAKSGWYYLNPEVEAQAKKFNGGLYIYTDRRRYEEDRKKLGETIRGEERLFEQGADQDEDMYIIGFIPLTIENRGYDKRIHAILEDHFNCKIVKKETANVATEWVEFPEGVDPVGVTLLAIQKEQQNPNAGRVELLLTLSQMKALDTALELYERGEVLLADLCPRFGKTVWSIALFDHSDAEVMVVGSYVLSSLNSFRNDLVRFTQFEHIALADSNQQVIENRANGLRSLVTVSLFDNFNAWEKKYKWVAKLPSKYVFIDEADFGAHTAAQVRKVNYLRGSEETNLCLMTGTAADRAVGTHKINSYISTTYFDLLVDKLSRNPVFESEHILSKYRVADNMDTIPGVRFYQYDFSNFLAEKNVLNPSWSKYAEKPGQNGVFTKTVLGEVLGTKHASGMLPTIAETIGEPITGIMLFVPRTTKINNGDFTNFVIPQINEVANEGYYIIELTGNTTDGGAAERYTTEEIKKAKALGKIPLIVTAGHIGSRSFSIPEINVVLLMYDGGSAATTGQNMSRGCTRGIRLDKVAHVFSLSIDPTREDAMVQAVLETAVKVAADTGEDIIAATKRVLRAMNVFAIDGYGDFVPVSVDEYAAKIMSSRSLRKVVGATSDVTKVLDDPISVQTLLAMTGEQVTLGKATTIGQKGKTFADIEGDSKTRTTTISEEESEAIKLLNKIKAAMKMIADQAHNIAAIAGSDKLTTALTVIANDSDLSRIFEDCFNVDAGFVNQLVEKGAVNGKLLDLVVFTYATEQQNIADEFMGEFA